MTAIDLANFLQAHGFGQIGQDLFVSFQPPEPDDCITVYDTGGYAPDIEVPLRDPTCQVLVRSTDYPVAMERAQGIYNLLHAKSNFAIGGYWVYLARAEHEPTPIGPDENGRPEITLNFHFKIRRG